MWGWHNHISSFARQAGTYNRWIKWNKISTQNKKCIYKNIYKCEDGHDNSVPHGLLRFRSRLSQSPLSTPLHRLLVHCILGEVAVHHGDKQQPHRPYRGVTRRSGDRVCRPGTEHVADVFRLGVSPESGWQSDADVALGLTTEHGVLYVVHRAGTIPTGTVCGPGHFR